MYLILNQIVIFKIYQKANKTYFLFKKILIAFFFNRTVKHSYIYWQQMLIKMN